MDRKELNKLLGLNLGIAAANIIIFSPAFIGLTLIGASAFETALGSTVIFLSGVGLTYGNYRLLSGPENLIQTNKIMTVDDYVEALNVNRGLKTFEKTVDILLDQIERLQKRIKPSVISFFRSFVPQR